jgi:hypothetical protein
MTERINDFNSRVIAAHNAHIVDGECTLIDVSPNASPNGNKIYHLYNDGTVTFQKGAYAYLKRSEFTSKCSVTGYNTIFKFPIETYDGLTTYAVLTQEQCNQFRTEMQEYMHDFLYT